MIAVTAGRCDGGRNSGRNGKCNGRPNDGRNDDVTVSVTSGVTVSVLADITLIIVCNSARHVGGESGGGAFAILFL